MIPPEILEAARRYMLFNSLLGSHVALFLDSGDGGLAIYSGSASDPMSKVLSIADNLDDALDGMERYAGLYAADWGAILDSLQSPQPAQSSAVQMGLERLRRYHTLRMLLRQQLPLALERLGLAMTDPTLDVFVGELASAVHLNWDGVWEETQKAFRVHEKKENKHENPDPLDDGPHGLAGPDA
jgi:hypothetical protein